ncbi:MAG: acetylxylan esterase, partial [Prevotella sp.]|nr:acetylxylan esterase [Prevotella sp.]
MRQSLQRLIICLAVIIALPHQAAAQIRGNNITVTVTPDHKDWTYRTGEKATFTICVLKSGTLLDNASISYELGPEMYPEVKKDMVLKKGSTTISGTMKRPGFLKLRAVAHVGGK